MTVDASDDKMSFIRIAGTNATMVGNDEIMEFGAWNVRAGFVIRHVPTSDTAEIQFHFDHTAGNGNLQELFAGVYSITGSLQNLTPTLSQINSTVNASSISDSVAVSAGGVVIAIGAIADNYSISWGGAGGLSYNGQVDDAVNTTTRFEVASKEFTTTGTCATTLTFGGSKECMLYQAAWR